MKVKTFLKQSILATACLTLISLGSGCSSVGDMRGGGTGTDVQLNQKNYRIIRAGAIGHSYGFSLLGIVPFDSPTASDAKADLYRSVGEDLTGKAVALANQTEDHSSLYLILFSIPRITYTADVIEFIDQPAQSAAPVQQVAVPVQQVAAPVQPAMAPAQQTAAPVQQAAAPH